MLSPLGNPSGLFDIPFAATSPCRFVLPYTEVSLLLAAMMALSVYLNNEQGSYSTVCRMETVCILFHI
jgi:hypothetical protein